VSGPERDDWDDHRLDAAFQARFDQPAPPHLRERIAQEITASSARPRLLQSFRAVTRTAIAAIAIVVGVIATMTIGGVGPKMPPGSSASTPGTALPTSQPFVGTVGPPFPSVIRLPVFGTTYVVISVADAAAIRDGGVDDREIAVAGWYQPLRPIPCPLAPASFQPLEDCALDTSWLVLLPNSLDAIDVFGKPSGPAIHPVTEWAPPSGARTPMAVVFVGHFDDARAARCIEGERRQRCEDRFVVDTVAWDEGASLAGFPTNAGGLPVISVSQAIIDRESDVSGELAIAGWYQDPSTRLCPYSPPVAVPFLEGDCSISAQWFMDAPESIIQVTRTAGSIGYVQTVPLELAFNPVFPTISAPRSHPLPVQGGSTPTKAILIGHFSDSRALLCSSATPQQCHDRFVVDAVPWVEGVERVLPERPDSRDQATPAAFDPVQRVRDVGAAAGTILNVAAVAGDELLRIEPGFDLAGFAQSNRRSFWIVTAMIDGANVGAVGTFVVDGAGVVYDATGTAVAIPDVTPVSLSAPSTLAAEGIRLCGVQQWAKEVGGIGIIDHARLLPYYVPLTGREPEIQRDTPAFVVQYSGQIRLPLRGGPGSAGYTDATGTTCVVLDGAPRFYITGPATDSLGRPSTPEPAPLDTKDLPAPLP